MLSKSKQFNILYIHTYKVSKCITMQLEIFRYSVKVQKMHGNNQNQINERGYIGEGMESFLSEMNTQVASTLLALFFLW